MHRAASTTDRYTLLDQQLMARATRYFAWQARVATPYVGQRVIEAGCGTGNFTRHLTDRAMVLGVDVVEECVERTRSRFAEYPNLQFRCLDVQDPAFLELKSLCPDTILCMNVLEHVENDLLALKHMQHVLAPGGKAILLLPAFDVLYGPIDRNLGHFRRYSKRSWIDTAEQAGFRVSRVRYFNLAGFFGWWVNSHVLRRETQSAAQIGIFDTIAAPVQSRLEKWIEPPVGQSIFSVLEK